MMDYEGLWRGFLVLFALVPAVIGAFVGAAWGWGRGRRGAVLIGWAFLCAIALSLTVFIGAILYFRA